MSIPTDLLARLPLLRDLPPEELERIAAASRRETFEPGRKIFEFGEPGRCAYFVLEGNARVTYPTQSTDVELARLSPGDLFGELALLDTMPRSVTVRAIDRVDTLVLDKDDFRRVLHDVPEVAAELLQTLSTRIRRANEQISALSDKAALDPLTGLFNQRAFDERLTEEVERARRYGSHFSLILVDLDGFSAVNDTLGQDAGDELLAWVGRVIKEHTRATDVPFRIGGEAFGVLCPVLGSSVARGVVARLIGVVGEATPPTGRELTVTMCGGYAGWPEHGDTPADLQAAAFRAMRLAKEAGRSQVGDPTPARA